MLNLLQIRNFAIIDDLEIELSSGFTAITGETGAGKSILVDALGLLLGGRADSNMIRSGCDRAELSAEFTLDESSEALAWLQQSELDEQTVCLVRRVIADSGRSRAWINGVAVTMGQLQELGEKLVEIHGQNEHIRLTRRSEAFFLLDSSGEYADRLSALAGAFEAWQETSRQLDTMASELPLSSGELDLLRYQVEELEGVAIPADAYEELSREHDLLARGGDVVERLQTSLDLLQSEDHASGPLLQSLAGRLAKDSGSDADIANAHRALTEAAINCEEARQSLEAALSRIDLSPERLARLDEKMSQLHSLGRKHRSEPGDLLQVKLGLEVRIERASGQEQERKRLEQQLQNQLDAYRTAAEAVHAAREDHARNLSGSVTDLMQILGMEGGVFQLQVELQADRPPSRRGDDNLDMLVSANPGMAPGPLRKLASGGELSRISLAIKVAGAGMHSRTTQVFDEVDSGVGGETANAVGRLLQTVASGAQALCVTHLAQVAVCADQQIRVSKDASDESTRVETAMLDEKERVDEIARMLGGKLSEQSRAHARELLGSALTRH